MSAIFLGNNDKDLTDIALTSIHARLIIQRQVVEHYIEQINHSLEKIEDIENDIHNIHFWLLENRTMGKFREAVKGIYAKWPTEEEEAKGKRDD